MRTSFTISVLLWFIGTSHAGMAQYVSRLGRFQINEIRGCAPLTVTILNTNLQTQNECTPEKPCQMTFEGSQSSSQNTLSYAYTKVGTYTLQVLYGSIDPQQDDIQITVLPGDAKPFEAYICFNNGVEAQLPPSKEYNGYYVDFGDSSPEQKIPLSAKTEQHQYAAAGNYNISLRGYYDNAKDNCPSRTKNIAIAPAYAPPKLNEITANADNSLALQFDAVADTYQQIELGINSGGQFQKIVSIDNARTYSLPGLDFVNNYYCARLNAPDLCAAKEYPSNVVCTQKITAKAVSDAIEIRWDGLASGLQGTQIWRDNSLLSAVTSSAATSYLDMTVQCPNKYCYQLIGVYSNGSKSISITQCARANSTAVPPPIVDISIIAEQETARIEWIPPSNTDVEAYTVNRAIYKAPALPLGRTTQPFYQDDRYEKDIPTCYQVVYRDKCGNNSPMGGTACAVDLKITEDGRHQLSFAWNGYVGWQQGVASYELTQVDENGNVLQTVNVGAATSYQETQPDLQRQAARYYVRTKPTDATLKETISAPTDIVKTAKIYAPNVFTPNADNLNDQFCISGHFIRQMELSIFDRWGFPIFNTKNASDCWDGTKNGAPLPAGAYTWQAHIADFTGRETTHYGTVLLLKKK